MILRVLLIPIAAGVLAGSPALGGDPNAPCAATDKRQEVADRCILVTAPAIRGQVQSDHGASVGEAYDAQGNPVDRHGNIVAVPENRSGLREVFAYTTR